jgi:hypothetical protein
VSLMTQKGRLRLKRCNKGFTNWDG